MEKIQNKQDKLLEDTGALILADQAFSKWLNEEDSRLLWLHGDPGKGKTMLATSLIKAMANRIQLEGGRQFLRTSSATIKTVAERRVLLSFEV